MAEARDWGRRESVHSCERNCWRMGVLGALKVEVEEVLRERKTLREAPVRSIVTVVALAG